MNVLFFTQQYWRNTHGAIVVYDITDHQSLEHALEWKRHLDNSVIQRDGSYIPAVLVGNKVCCEVALINTDVCHNTE